MSEKIKTAVLGAAGRMGSQAVQAVREAEDLELVAALRSAGASWVVLAGRPGPKTVPEDELDDSCAMGIDALAFLHRLREELAR